MCLSFDSSGYTIWKKSYIICEKCDICVYFVTILLKETLLVKSPHSQDGTLV